MHKIDQVHSGGDYQKHPQKRKSNTGHGTRHKTQDTRHNKNKTQQLIEIKEHKSNPLLPDR